MSCRAAKIVVLFCVVIISFTLSIFAQNSGGREVDIKIYFPYDSALIDSTYMDNGSSLHLADSLLCDTTYASWLQKIEISAQSSIEGSMRYNERLSERRIEALKEYFTTHYSHIDSALWSFSFVAENWELFNQAILDDPNFPNRERVLEISNSERDPDAKEWLLRTLNGGDEWAYIKQNILSAQRFGAKILFVPILYAPMASPPIFEQCDFPKLSVPPVSEDNDRVVCAIKTNLLLDAVTAVNLAVEIPIGERWSVVGEVVYPWWRSWSKDFTMQIESYHAEAKYWLGERASKEQLQGWSCGMYGGFGRYDIQPLKSTGVQGDFFDVGVEVAYSHSIAKNLNLEYALGLGYLSTSYNDYKMVDDTEQYGDVKVIPYPWMNNSFKSVFPTRLAVSLVWLIKSRGGDRR